MAGFLLSERLKSLGADVYKHQSQLLLHILKVNRETKVARHFSLQTVSSIEEFRTQVPLTSYKDYEDFSLDVRENGTEDVFFPGRADYVAMTSGTTTGTNKHFPKSLKVLKFTAGKWIVLSQKCFLDIKKNNYLRKWLVVKATPKPWLCPSGIRTGPISSLAGSYSFNPFVAPALVNEITNEQDVIYLNLVFGLKSCDICNLFFSTAQTALLFFQALERRWAQICNDIETGRLSQELNISEEMRSLLSQFLYGKDPDRAAFLRLEFQRGFIDIVPRIWPDCPGLFCMATGAFQTQVGCCLFISTGLSQHMNSRGFRKGC